MIESIHMLSNNQLKKVFERTQGHCHFCGDAIEFEKYGCKDPENTEGVWEADHVIQKGKGGSKDVDNCLPACYRCNRLRWHRKGNEIRELLFLGLIAKDEIKKIVSWANSCSNSKTSAQTQI